MRDLLHPLGVCSRAPDPLPSVCYGGRCPQTGRELYLGPTPEAVAEAETLKDYLRSRRQAEEGFSCRGLYAPFTGKMFGVMVCRDGQGRRGALRAFSGEWLGRRQPGGWVSSGQLEGIREEVERTEERLRALTRRIEALEAAQSPAEAAACKAERRGLSRALTDRIHAHYRFENALGEVLPLNRVETGGRRPPTGMGECCAPKLLQHAVRHGLEPLGMVEFWWGASPGTEPRVEGAYYSACRRKCYPILGFLLRGVEAARVAA